MGKSIITTSLATAAAAVVGSVASRQGVETWYPTLRKPRYVPPNAVFPVAWTTLYADIAVTSAATIEKFRGAGEGDKARAYVGALGANLVLNASWSWLFFKRHKLGQSAIVAGALAVSSADLARRAAQADPKFGAALTPYPLWCSFATLMSTDIWRLNR
ncbi:tryptophan-rich sensory protein [Mycobacterium sp. CVI_P3]|uniref:Tryptophan-rich sensory protein n=1 Tax=Mycobacterium pinniadriaticum TaxID=2994102 RepID=A0ABT3SDP0_9MYCO|nr:TspO/MBR family protein [Mycobacterium pinniadriaticum]MCX2931157.1 tryptophan-rich sensory protein [Mycobacterium pinniadriaticum]MCX2937619.1 tryptophan-rich sensory protein [Mycobacterium pinniadriaticum]